MTISLARDVLPPRPELPAAGVSWLLVAALVAVVIGSIAALVALARRRR